MAATKPDSPTPLEWATLDELIHELRRRGHSMLLYLEYDDHGQARYAYSRGGDPLRLLGAVDARIRPELMIAGNVPLHQ